MWPHNCPVNGPTETEASEPCPWCDAEAPHESARDEATTLNNLRAVKVPA